MIRLCAFALLPLFAVQAEPISWEKKLKQAGHVLEYLEMQEAGPEATIEMTRKLVIPKANKPGDIDRVIEIPPHTATWDLLPSAIRAKLKDPEAGHSSGEKISRFEIFELADLVRYRFVPVKKMGDEAWSAGRGTWATSIEPYRELEKVEARGVKGIGGIDQPKHLEDLLELGIRHATVNIHLNAVLHTEEGPNRSRFTFENTRYYLDDAWCDKLDKIIGFLSKHEIVVSAILLVTPPRGEDRHLMIHPEADPAGTLAMPNLATAEGAKCYAAVLSYLAERYTRPDSSLGRISNWIAHNEVDQAWTWVNMGEQPMPRLLETYYRSMRVIHGITRKFDPHARVFASFTHHWNHEGDGKRTYNTREMLTLLNRLSKAEGDFPWGIAFHPYPQNLLKPRTWEDNEPIYSLDTPKISMKNIEVLTTFLDQPKFRFQGRRRPLMLTEQGFHTAQNSAAAQLDQAAALVYSWHKLRALPHIEAFHYHRWIDHPHEGGLKLGLRSLPTPSHPIGEKKKSWAVYQALGTNREAKESSFALEHLGVKRFADIPYRGKIDVPEEPAKKPPAPPKEE